MDPTVLGAIVGGLAMVVVAVLGLGATRQAARRASDLETLRTVIAEQRTELLREREDHDHESTRLRARIRELEAPGP